MGFHGHIWAHMGTDVNELRLLAFEWSHTAQVRLRPAQKIGCLGGLKWAQK